MNNLRSIPLPDLPAHHKHWGPLEIARRTRAARCTGVRFRKNGTELLAADLLGRALHRFSLTKTEISSSPTHKLTRSAPMRFEGTTSEMHMIDVDETEQFLVASSWTQGASVFDCTSLGHLQDVRIPTPSTTVHTARFVPHGFAESGEAKLLVLSTLEPCGSCFFLELGSAKQTPRVALRFRPNPDAGWRTKDLRFFPEDNQALLVQDRTIGPTGPKGSYESRVLLLSICLRKGSENAQILEELVIPESQVDGIALGKDRLSSTPFFVTDQMHDEVLVFDLVHDSKEFVRRTSRIQLPSRSFPHGIDYDPTNDLLAVACLGPNHVLLLQPPP